MQQSLSMFPGVEGLKAIYEDILKCQKADFVCLSVDYEQIIGNWYDRDFNPRLSEAPVAIREIVADTEENRQYAKKKTSPVRFIADAVIEADWIVTESWAALLVYDKQSPYGVKFVDPIVVKSFTQAFTERWERASV